MGDKILDILNSGPKKILYIIDLLEETGVPNYNTPRDGIKPIQACILSMLVLGEIELTEDRCLKIKS